MTLSLVIEASMPLSSRKFLKISSFLSDSRSARCGSSEAVTIVRSSAKAGSILSRTIIELPSTSFSRSVSWSVAIFYSYIGPLVVD